jgi:hypothetical protein
MTWAKSLTDAVMADFAETQACDVLMDASTETLGPSCACRPTAWARDTVRLRPPSRVTPAVPRASAEARDTNCKKLAERDGDRVTSITRLGVYVAVALTVPVADNLKYGLMLTSSPGTDGTGMFRAK